MKKQKIKNSKKRKKLFVTLENLLLLKIFI